MLDIDSGRNLAALCTCIMIEIQTSFLQLAIVLKNSKKQICFFLVWHVLDAKVLLITHYIFLINFAGLPPTSTLACTSLTTTEPDATTELSPILTPGFITE